MASSTGIILQYMKKSEVQAKDTELQNNITAEATTRQTNDETLDSTLRAEINKKVTRELASTSGGKAYVFNETDGGGVKLERTDGTNVFVGVNDSDGNRASNNAFGSIYALNSESKGIRFTIFQDMITYKANASKSERNNANYELAVKADVQAADDKINFSELINRVFTYGYKWGTEVHKLELMVKPGMYFVSTDASVVGGEGDNLPTGETEGLLMVTKNGQLLICGITGRQYYRHQDLASDNVTAYTSDNTESGTPIAWIPSAMLSDVTAEANLRAALDAAVTASAAAAGSAITVVGDGATKTIGLTLADNTLSQTASGLKSELKLKKQDTAEEGYAATYFLTDSTGTNVIGDKINLIKDSVLKSASIYNATGDAAPADWGSSDPYVKGHKYIRFVWETKSSTAAGTESIFYLDVEGLVDSYTGVDCIVVDKDNNQIKLQIAAASEQVTVGSGVTAAVLSQDGNGLAVSNIQNAIDYAISVEAGNRASDKAELQTNIDNEASARATAVAGVDAKINFSEIINRIGVYPNSIHDVKLMVTPGVYYVSTALGDSIPVGDGDGILIVTGNGQTFICGSGGTADGRIFYRHQDNAPAGTIPVAYTDDNTASGTSLPWIESALMSDLNAEAEVRSAADDKLNAKLSYEFINAETAKTLEDKLYVVRNAKFTGTLPESNIPDNVAIKIIVNEAAAALGGTIQLASGSEAKINGGTDAFALDQLMTVTFIYDKANKDWIALAVMN